MSQHTDLLDHALNRLKAETSQIVTRARRARLDATMRKARANWYAIDAARLILRELGDEYVETAKTVIESARIVLLQLDVDVTEAEGRAEVERIASERTTAYDVIAWFEHHGIQFTAAQSFRIERLLNA